MLNSFLDLFISLLHSALKFDYILYLIFGVLLISTLSTVFIYLFKGRY